MSGLLLRLAGPLQSWGERSHYSQRDTAAFPTRSGLLGMLAAAHGRRRGDSLNDLAHLDFTIRVDRPGTRMIDYQTIGGGLPRGQKVPTADGGGRPEDKKTMQTWREYLADAVFAVAVTGPADVLEETRRALRSPRWQPYLGRRSCPPAEPLLLDKAVDDPIAELTTSLPLARRTPRDEFVEVDLVHPTDDAGGRHSEVHDVPGHTGQRSFRPRPIWIERASLPANLGVPSLRHYPRRLAEYLRGAE